MAPTGPGERAVQLPWFWPSARTIEWALDHTDSSLANTLLGDVGFSFFVLTNDLPFSGAANPSDLRLLASMIERDDVPWIDWRKIPEIARTAYACSRFAGILNDTLQVTCTEKAALAGWLPFSGWLAVGIVDPGAATDAIGERTSTEDPFALQRRMWGVTRSEIAWRLSTQWTVPKWAQVTLGRLDVCPSVAGMLGGDRKIHALVQIATILAEQTETRLFVADEFDLAEALSELQVRSPDLDQIREIYAKSINTSAWLYREWADPRLMPDLSARLRQTASHAQESEFESLTETVLIDLTDERIHAAKLAAVAEFAAGASHEINNPLAVISGHSEYLLKHEEDADRRKSLQSIMRQTERVHALLTELMYFARPPALKREWLELSRFVRDSIEGVRAMAVHRDVRLDLDGVSIPLWVNADPKHLKIALTALVRNGIEAVPVGGWVRVQIAFLQSGVEIIVDDSGPGPDERSREHLFDPFYSGRTAGRGRGLGLPAAWRLAREHGGNVRFVPLPDGPTRFILSLPTSAVMAGAQRKSA